VDARTLLPESSTARALYVQRRRSVRTDPDRARAKRPHAPRTALARRVEQAKQADAARQALLAKQAQEGLNKAMDYIEAELWKPLAFEEKTRGTIGRMAHGIGALLLRCFGPDLR
jgi:hypothetical protein